MNERNFLIIEFEIIKKGGIIYIILRMKRINKMYFCNYISNLFMHDFILHFVYKCAFTSIFARQRSNFSSKQKLHRTFAIAQYLPLSCKFHAGIFYQSLNKDFDLSIKSTRMPSLSPSSFFKLRQFAFFKAYESVSCLTDIRDDPSAHFYSRISIRLR